MVTPEPEKRRKSTRDNSPYLEQSQISRIGNHVYKSDMSVDGEMVNSRSMS